MIHEGANLPLDCGSQTLKARHTLSVSEITYRMEIMSMRFATSNHVWLLHTLDQKHHFSEALADVSLQTLPLTLTCKIDPPV